MEEAHISPEKWLPTSNHSYSKKGYLLKLDALQTMIECALISPYIKDEKPLSLLIVAKPESGKSTLLKLYRDNKGIVYLSDCTAYGLTRDVLPKILNDDVKTIMIPDLLTPLAKQTKTRKSFIAFINGLIEEGVAKMSSYSTMWSQDTDVKANIITAITEDALRDARHGWAKMGFLSRFIIFSYSYHLSTVAMILRSYSYRGLTLKPLKVKLPRAKQIKVFLASALAEQLNPHAMKIGEQFQLYGFRAKINFRCLLKCLAYRQGRKVVIEEDLDAFLKLADYMNFRFNAL
jgi:hypothetical protein